ncbi:hypothetical protein AGMMS50239_35820 [Bacteroidia bacterium]|nr:hypothetical protein AGMMS50239_35820 [Bacteroidia bacterium]
MYDLSGSFKRIILPSFVKEINRYSNIYNFDKEHLLFYYENQDNIEYVIELLLISKQTGEVRNKKSFPFEKKLVEYLQTELSNEMYSFLGNLKYVSNHNKHAYLNLLADTIYKLTPNFTLEPIMARTPSIQNLVSNFLVINADTENYRFMTLTKNGANFSSTALVLNKQTGKISEQSLYNSDDVLRTPVKFGPKPTDIQSVENNQYYCFLQPFQLKEAYEQGNLRNELKAIASKIEEDENPIVMLIRFK